MEPAAQRQFNCERCGKRCKSERGIIQHLRFCNPRNENDQEVGQPPPAPQEIPLVDNNAGEAEKFWWGEKRGSEVEKDLVDIYEKIVFWRRNLFMLPNGSSGKAFIRETTRLLNSWSENTPLKDCALRAIHVMPALLLQKPSKTSKSKEHVNTLERRLESWKRGDLLKLFREAEAIQSRLPINNGKRDMAATSRRFKELMQKGNVNGAIKLLTNNMKGGILPLNNETMELLRTKHPERKEAIEDALLPGEVPMVQPIIFESIDEDMVLKAAQITKGGSGPSGMDADGWRKILSSRVYGDTGRDLRRAFANVIKKMCVDNISDNSLEALMASRLVPLDKNPGLRPIGVGEVLRRIAGKIVMSITKEDVVRASSKAQMCGRKAGSEAAIHAMKEMFEAEQSEAVLLVDAANAFNSVNRQALLHNISISCPPMATFVKNCYQSAARLFVVGGKELRSKEGTTQGDPLGMAIYAIAISPLLDIMVTTAGNNSKMAAFADDMSASGKVVSLKECWIRLIEVGPKYGYYPQPTKSWLIVKPEQLDEARRIFEGTGVQITTEGERHLGAVIGAEEYKEKYVRDTIAKWVSEVSLLSQIATTQPQAAYACFTAGYQHKLTYHLRTIPGMEDYLQPFEDIIRHHFIPAITGGHVVNDKERSLLSLPPRLGGLGLKNFVETAPFEYENSRGFTLNLKNLLLDKNEEDGKTKHQIQAERKQRQQARLTNLQADMTSAEKRQSDANLECGVSNWLTTLPLKEWGYDLNKQQFWDALRIRYDWNLERLPANCVCGEKFDISHALSCKKGGLITLRHNELRDITANLLKEICRDVRTEPSLIEVNGEVNGKTANTRPEARLDISALGFWTPDQRVFFDIRVFNLQAQRYRCLELKKCFERNEKEKKRHYNERVLQVENGSFTPLVFATNGAMSRECQAFYKRMAEMVAEKRHINISVATNVIRTKISFTLVRSMLRCIRGSRSRTNSDNLNDFHLADQAQIRRTMD